jgi:hypothetical protein
MNKLSCPICHGTFQHKEGCQNADYAYKLRERIEELEAELHANQQSWQEHDQGRIFAAKQMRLRIAKLEKENRILRLKLACVHLGQGADDAVEELSGDKVEQEICPRCNQEMDSPHYCRPDVEVE